MAAPVSEKEKKRRLAAFEQSKKIVPGGSITEAAKILGDVSPGALSRFLLNISVKTDRRPAFSKEECVAALKAHIGRHKGIPSRDQFNAESAVGVRWKTHWRRWDKFLEEAGVINDGSKILLLDIETAPILAMVWGTRKQYINHEWIVENGYILCWSAKWLDSDEMMFQKFQRGKPLAMLKPIHALLDEAHAVVHYNGKKFDVPTLNREFLLHNLKPPSPYKQIDCLQTMWDTFAFPVNKLDYIAKILGIGQKIEKEGPQFWKDCMEDKPEAWKKMEAYNRHDVTLLEGVYKRILPWIKKHPNRAALSGLPVCPSCGSFDINQDPRPYVANQLKYQQYNCGDCGVWFRGTKAINPRGEKRFALTA
jgi:hypothetical protein